MFIESGPAYVIASGTATTFGGHPLTMILQMPEDNLVVELAFDSAPEVDEHVVYTETTDVGYRLRCVNFDDASGRGSALPVLLGELGDELVFLHFRAFRYGQTPDRTVHYTFYRAHKDKVGWTPDPS